MISPNEKFDVKLFIDLYQDIYKKAKKNNRPLVIVGGTSFYLKMLVDGISPTPKISLKTILKTKEILQDIQNAHKFLNNIDKKFMSQIETTDKYRVEKALNIYFETDLTPSEYFKTYPPKSIIQESLPIYEIITQKDDLRKKITQRTQNMINDGLIDEVAYLEKIYTRKPNSMKSIGIKETLNYLDGRYSKELMKEKIIINTARLAKRQKTFNNSQFTNKNLVTLDFFKNSELML